MESRKATIKDIAKHTGLSIATVSRVVNRTGIYYTKETEEKVKKAVEELSYVPHAIARELKSRKRCTIGYLVPNVDDYYAQVFSGIQNCANKRNYTVVLLNSNYDKNQEEIIIRNIKEQRYAGLIIATGLMNDDTLLELNKEAPVVSIGKISAKYNIPYVAINDYDISKNAINYLISLGHKRIAFLCGSLKIISEKDRFNGYIDALQENGIKIDPSIIYEGEVVSKNSLNGCYNLIQQIMEEEKDITSFFILSDYGAYTAVKAITDLGKRVPYDISVVGFDNLPISEFSIPPLTTVSQDKNLIGRKSMQMLFDLMEGIQVTGINIDTELVIRGSTGKPK